MPSLLCRNVSLPLFSSFSSSITPCSTLVSCTADITFSLHSTSLFLYLMRFPSPFPSFFSFSLLVLFSFFLLFLLLHPFLLLLFRLFLLRDEILDAPVPTAEEAALLLDSIGLAMASTLMKVFAEL